MSETKTIVSSEKNRIDTKNIAKGSRYLGLISSILSGDVPDDNTPVAYLVGVHCKYEGGGWC